MTLKSLALPFLAAIGFSIPKDQPVTASTLYIITAIVIWVVGIVVSELTKAKESKTDPVPIDPGFSYEGYKPRRPPPSPTPPGAD